MAKNLYHSELVKKSPATVVIKSDVLNSKFPDKPPYVILELDGEDRNYTTESVACEQFFEGRKNQTLTITATGSKEEAQIHQDSEALPFNRQPAQGRREEPPREQARPQQPAATVPAIGMRATEVRYEYTLGLPNYCSEKIGVTVQLDPGTKAEVAFEFAKKFVHVHLKKLDEAAGRR